MAAPTKTSRTQPVGLPLRRGFRSLISFSSNASLLLWEKSVKPPSIKNGDPIDNTTMWNEAYETFYPPALTRLEPQTVKAAYDVQVYAQLIAMGPVNQTITVFFSTGRYLAFYGYFGGADFDEMVPRSQPEMTVTIQPTQYDSVNDVEAGVTLGTGT